VSIESPLISIVIPTWNRPALVARLVGLINAADGGEDLEIVVVDNDSKQENWTQLQQVGSTHKNVRLYRNSVNIGMTPNWNKAIEHARGAWIGFMCDDDMFKPDSIARIREIIGSVTKPCLVLQNSGVVGESDWLEPGVLATNKMSLPPASGQFWHRELTDKLGRFDERIKYCPDAEFWLRLAYHYPVYRVRDYLVIPYQHDTNYMWEAFRSPDFLEQVELSITLSSQHTLGEKFSDTKLVRERVDDGLWETLRTVLNNTFLRHGKMKNFPLYFVEFIKVSIRMGRGGSMTKTLLSLPIKRAKELVRGFVKKS
jgi:glycosyltransferase involved in cell wall biosynthesis